MNNQDTYIIGIAGASRAGKDTLAANILKKYKNDYKAKIYSFAHNLKTDLQPLLKEKLDIDVFTDDTSVKNIFRPLLVAYGATFRELSKGSYWWQKIKEEIDKDFASGEVNLAIIPDFRFAEPRFAGNDEIDFIQSYENHYIITVEQYGIEPVFTEIENLPIIKNQSNFILKWPNFGKEKLEKSYWYCSELFTSLNKHLFKK